MLYVAAIPFYRLTLQGDLVFTIGLRWEAIQVTITASKWMESRPDSQLKHFGLITRSAKSSLFSVGPHRHVTMVLSRVPWCPGDRPP